MRHDRTAARFKQTRGLTGAAKLAQPSFPSASTACRRDRGIAVEIARHSLTSRITVPRMLVFCDAVGLLMRFALSLIFVGLQKRLVRLRQAFRNVPHVDVDAGADGRNLDSALRTFSSVRTYLSVAILPVSAPRDCDQCGV
jgi:hypothetical protein